MRRLAVLAGFQVLALLSWAGYHEHVRATAPTFRIPLRPRDPFDLVRGRYFTLNPVDASFDWRSTFLPYDEIERFLGPRSAFAGTAQVGFCPVEQVYRICALAHRGEKPRAGPARFWCRGFVTVGKSDAGWKLQVDLGLRRFFIPNRLQLPARENAEGWELEVSYRPGLSPLPRRLFFRGTPIELD